MLGEVVGVHKLVTKRQSIVGLEKKLFSGTEDILGLLDGAESPKKAANAHTHEHSRGGAAALNREKKSAGARNPDLMQVFSDEAGGERGPPTVKFVPTKEVMQKMIRKATLVKKLEDLDYF